MAETFRLELQHDIADIIFQNALREQKRYAMMAKLALEAGWTVTNATELVVKTATATKPLETAADMDALYG